MTNMNTGVLLRKTLEKAWKWSKAQREVATSLDATISKGTLLRWTKMVTDYKKDSSKPNPFRDLETSKQFFPHPCHRLSQRINSRVCRFPEESISARGVGRPEARLHSTP